MIKRIYKTNLDLRFGDLEALSKFDKLEETPAIGTRIQLKGFQLEVCSVTYKYVDAFWYEIVIEVHLPKGQSNNLSAFTKWYNK